MCTIAFTRIKKINNTRECSVDYHIANVPFAVSTPSHIFWFICSSYVTPILTFRMSLYAYTSTFIWEKQFACAECGIQLYKNTLA